MHWSERGSNLPQRPYSLLSEEEWLELRRGAAEALVDAALAIALGDRLSEATRQTLLAPWLRATVPQGRSPG